MKQDIGHYVCSTSSSTILLSPSHSSPPVITLHTNQQVPVKDSWSGDDEAISSSAPLNVVDKFCPATQIHTHARTLTNSNTQPPVQDPLGKRRAVKHTAVGHLLTLNLLRRGLPEKSRGLLCVKRLMLQIVLGADINVCVCSNPSVCVKKIYVFTVSRA